MQDLKILSLAEQLVVSAMPVLDKIPRAQRYRYGRQLEDALYALPRLAIAAAAAGTKSKVYALCEAVDYLHALLRIGVERKLVSARWVGHVMAAAAPPAKTGGLLRQLAAMSHAWRASVRA